MKLSTTIASALFLTSAAPLLAGTFDNAGVALAGSAPIARILNCTLAKTSFKEGGADQDLRRRQGAEGVQGDLATRLSRW